MDNEEWLRVADAAARLQIHPETVRAWLRAGRLRGTRLGGARADKIGWRIPAREVERVLRGGTDGQ